MRDYYADQLVGTCKDAYLINLSASGFASRDGSGDGSGFDHASSDLPRIDMLVLFFELFWNRPA